MSDEVKDNVNQETTQTNQEPVKDDVQSKIDSVIKDRLDRERQKWIKELGVEDVASAKEAIKKFREQQDLNKSEAEKLKEQIASIEKEKLEALSKAEMTEAKFTAVNKGVSSEKVEKFLKIVQTYEGENISDKIDNVIKDFPEFLKQTAPATIGAAVKSQTGSGDEDIKLQMRKAMGLK